MTLIRVPRTDFARRLKELRVAAGLSQFELATKVGISHTAISKLEADQRQPLWPVVVALARALGCATDDFLGEDDMKKPAAPTTDEYQDEDRATRRSRSKKS
jgi:transcriptional regulator with XRE-family HTH domain